MLTVENKDSFYKINTVKIDAELWKSIIGNLMFHYVFHDIMMLSSNNVTCATRC